jgi:hypothetical protein
MGRRTFNSSPGRSPFFIHEYDKWKKRLKIYEILAWNRYHFSPSTTCKPLSIGAGLKLHHNSVLPGSMPPSVPLSWV